MTRWRTLAAWVVAALALAAIAGCLWLLRRQTAAAPPLATAVNEGSYLLVGLILTLIGAFLATRRGDNVLSWLVLGTGAVLSLAAFVEQYTNRGVASGTGWPALLPALWLAQWLWLLPYVALLLLLHLFPTGRLLSPRWRWVLGLSLLAYLALAFALAFSTTLELTDPTIHAGPIANPVGFLRPLGAATLVPLTGVFPVTVAVALVSLGLRYRHAPAIERQQMKWLFFAAGLLVVALLLSMVLDRLGATWGGTVTNVVAITIPLAIAVAVLRYRLFDIDVIIRRTTSYALLTALLGLIYLASVVALQWVLSPLTGESTPAVVLSTLLIAALFLPVRRRVQDLIDRRFNRPHYDAAKTLARFAATARDETDLDALLAELQRVIQETMQPETVSLWLRERGTEDNGSERRRYG